MDVFYKNKIISEIKSKEMKGNGKCLYKIINYLISFPIIIFQTYFERY